jgi:hypothetical protein
MTPITLLIDFGEKQSPELVRCPQRKKAVAGSAGQRRLRGAIA